MRTGDRGLLAVIAAGGVIGSLGRWGLGLALPHADGEFPWATFAVNLTGSAAMGLLVVWVLSMDAPHRWLRPFLGVGVLGGWTTYSAYMTDARALLGEGRPGLAATYLASSLVLGLTGVAIGILVGESVFGRRP